MAEPGDTEKIARAVEARAARDTAGGIRISGPAIVALIGAAGVVVAGAVFGADMIGKGASAAQAAGEAKAQAAATAASVTSQGSTLYDHEKRLVKLEAMAETVRDFDHKLDRLLEQRAGK